MSIHNKLVSAQRNLKAPKSQNNDFGGYRYRSCEDILEAVKPILSDIECHLTLSDDIVAVADRVYVKATVTLSDGEHSISTSAFARETLEKKKSDPAQITGASSSYARKYALCGLFALDDTKDMDTNEYQYQEQSSKPNTRQKMNAAMDKSIAAIRESLAATDPSSCLEAWSELTQQEQAAIWGKFSDTEQNTIRDLLKVARGE